MDQSRYRENIDQAIRILEGKYEEVCDDLRVEMERAAELLAEYQSWLRRFAAAFRLPVLDFDRAFTRWGEEGLFQPDGLHPNAAGHCLMAETAAALIRSL